MRVFGVQSDGQFSEYVQTPFEREHKESVLEDWIESNPDRIIEGGRILIIGRQVVTNFGGYIDLLGLDREGDVVVLELKRNKTPRDTIAQSLEYVSFAERLDTTQLTEILQSYLNDESLNLTEYHREYFELGTDEAVAFNKEQRIVVVGQRITPAIRQTAAYLRSKGIRVTCVEFTFFRADGRTHLLSLETVVGEESDRPTRVSSGSLPTVTEDAFLASADENGRAVFARLLELARTRSMPVHWGTRGFSLNAEIDGTHVAICFVYPPSPVYGQTIRITLRGQGGVEKKTAVPERIIQALREQAEATGLFVPAGRGLKCDITRKLEDGEIDSLLAWCESVQEAVREHGLQQ
jgi:endonuclease NucS-like protein